MNAPNEPPCRILVAEDNRSIATLIESLLTRRGYQVERAADGGECLQKARTFAPDLLLLDLMLPKVHGMEVLRRLKADAHTAAIGVIMCTARKYKPDHDQAMELGAWDVLFKPFEKEELLGMVARFFSGTAFQKPERLVAAPTEAYQPQMTLGRPRYLLWGTRGSSPVSGFRHVRHGGNTSCLEINCGDDQVIVDAGSGIRELGLELVRQGPRRLHILISHTHWDHILGFPFFAPAYTPGFELVLYGAPGFGKDLKSVFSGQLDRDYFPVQFQDMQAHIEFRPLEEPPLDLGAIRLWWELTNHPGATLCFKFRLNDKTLAYVSDNEFLYGYLGAPQDITLDGPELVPHRPLVDFLTGVDLLIAEAQYTNQEYCAKVGWGHSSLSNACALAKLAKVRAWLVTHHDPQHDDSALDEQLNLTKDILRQLDCPIPVTHAYDGLIGYL